MRLNENMLLPYPEREKLISELLMAFKRYMPKYTGIEKKRLEVQVRHMKRYLKEMKEIPNV